jgi:hypothetical protein
MPILAHRQRAIDRARKLAEEIVGHCGRRTKKSHRPTKDFRSTMASHGEVSHER